ncbi:protein FAM111A isoform X2 [Salmo trutta]|nr:protein FAM111A-like isoform X2 [Salmo trutta]XP_029561896.1 protein FAM111A-like isoform X2 [Salmo trutta]XP_029561897.1 protein FAM111A-like isoform X2 [Salmo trutta]
MGDRVKKQSKLDQFLKRITRPSNVSNNQQHTPDQSPGADAKSKSSGNQPGASSQTQDSHIKKEAHDESHFFKYRFKSEYKIYSITCCHYGTVLDALQTSDIFKNTTKTKQGMEIVIQREKEPRAAVSTHFPCHLIDNDEEVVVSFIKGPNGSSSDTQGLSKQSKPPQNIQPDKLMAFCVETEGGQNVKRKVMKNPELRNKLNYVCVYGYKGEKVKHALRRDGRFGETIFTGCVLSDSETKVNTEMSQPVDGLDGKRHQGRKGEMLVVKVKRIGRVAQPQPDSLEDSDNTPTEELSIPAGGTSEAALSPQNPTTPDTVQTQFQSKETGKYDSSLVVKQKRQEISNSKEILNIACVPP